MRRSTSDSSHGVFSSAHMVTSAALRDPAGATDTEIAECVLLIWRDVSAAAAPRYAPTHPTVMHRAALHIFGRDSLQSAASLRHRYRQLAIRVHPDKNTSSQASEAFQVLQSCFEYAISSREAGGSGGIDAGEQAVFQRAADPSVSQRRDASRRGAKASGEADESHFSSSMSSSFTSSTSPRSPPLSPIFSGGSSSSSGQPSPTHPLAAAAAATTAEKASPPFSGCSAASAGEGVFPSAVLPEPPDVFDTTVGETLVAAVPAPSVFDDDSGGPAVPPSPAFGAPPTSRHCSTAAAAHRSIHRASADGRASLAVAASDSGPGPPLVREQASFTPVDSSAGDVLDGRIEATKQRSSQQQRRVRIPERPTLAELLARLDADDDDHEDSPKSAAERARGPFSQAGLHGSPARGCRNHGTAAVTYSGFPTRLWSSTMQSSASHSRGRASEGDDRKCSGAPATRCATMATAPIHPDVPRAAERPASSLRPSALADFCSALREEVSGAKRHHISPASPPRPYTSSGPLVGPTVRCRRAGGSGVGVGSGRWTRELGSGGSERERCACGKASRGRCFLCEE
ncbi:hypothetical protein LSCM4_03944 [Leishmania orientalis]|uniref:J domain-containing protein n=1 Tax=Leishmania orientalis TaxID=2249476 RepID=A0A836H414_9TRYP|nr:hypothetical protein LSCM4_03944 [Leishmania orientalis]